ncbi:hypothetical protein [Hoeflea sp.]|uniref:hypothetical protein n=1 Tax=Hoeflea sp. TaxID=1940281 RepID=UPI00374915C0
MIRFAVLSIAVMVILDAAPTVAQEPIANRFTLEKTENGFVRMDTQTGEMSICAEQQGQLVCRLAADERRAFEESLSDLSDRVAVLEQRLEIETPGEKSDGIPDEAELNRALDAMNKMMRGFFGMVEDLRKEFDEGANVPGVPPEPIPDRT